MLIGAQLGSGCSEASSLGTTTPLSITPDAGVSSSGEMVQCFTLDTDVIDAVTWPANVLQLTMNEAGDELLEIDSADAMCAPRSASDEGAVCLTPPQGCQHQYGVASPVCRSAPWWLTVAMCLPGAAAAEDAPLDFSPAELVSESPAPAAGPVRLLDLAAIDAFSAEELERVFIDSLGSLGSISVGFPSQGRLLNGVQLPEGKAWHVADPEGAWGTREVIDAVTEVAAAVRRELPSIEPLRVNRISAEKGGYMKPHSSHQSGRDVDLGFYYREGADRSSVHGNRIPYMNMAANWALVRNLVTRTDVEFILVDQRVRDALHDYAIQQGEDHRWVESIFKDPKDALVQHARRHRDHFHVRFFSPRAQHVGRLVQPILASRSDDNLISYRVRSGDTLGHIASRYNSGVRTIQRANRMQGSFLRTGQWLSVPMLGPCTQCPLPPPLVLPPRRLPPPSFERASPAPVPDAIAGETEIFAGVPRQKGPAEPPATSTALRMEAPLPVAPAPGGDLASHVGRVGDRDGP